MKKIKQRVLPIIPISPKKMYYNLDNSDTDQIVDSLEACMEIIKGEWEDQVKDFKETANQDDAPYWTVTPIWMTEEEFKSLPDAY